MCGYTCELVAPAGSFTAGISALESGADAVYAGLSRFSARARARNLSLAELSRLIAFARQRDRKVYVALNTLVGEQEFTELCRLLAELVLLQPAGVIIQDYGLLELLNTYFPELPVHASTQLAVHNLPGAQYLWKAGIKRIVLAREMTLAQIGHIRRELPQLELEVFIHGALCYSVSGLCLASGMLLGRSGNRGECAQICRTWFEQDDRKEYFFSCNDLALQEQVWKLSELGVTALKIEGRMKDPEYAALAAAYYRSIFKGEESGVRGELFSRLNLAFSRRRSTAFFTHPRGRELIYTQHSSRSGLPAGEILKVTENILDARLSRSLQVHDGLMYLTTDCPPAAVKFGIRQLEKNHRSIYKAGPKDVVRIFASQPLSPPGHPGSPLYQISAADQHAPEKKSLSFPPSVYPLKGEIYLTANSLRFQLAGSLPPASPAFLKSAFPLYCYEEACSVQRARGSGNFRDILSRLFRRNGKRPFRVELLAVHNSSPCEDSALFLPPGFLKSFKNNVYTHLEELWGSRKAGVLQQIAAAHVFVDVKQGFGGIAPAGKTAPPPADEGEFKRAHFSYGRWQLPFVTDPSDLKEGSLPFFRGQAVLALPPVMFRPDEYLEKLMAFLSKQAGGGFLVGLNNPSQLKWLDKLSTCPGINFFVDYALYCANRFAYAYFCASIPRLAFMLYWVEGTAEDYLRLFRVVAGGAVPLLCCGADFRPPLFVSRICYRRHSLGQSCRDCRKGYEYNLLQNKRRYRVVVQDCLSYMLSAD